MSTQKLVAHVHGQNSQKVETAQIPIKCWVGKQNLVYPYNVILGFPGGSVGKKICLPMLKTWVQSLGQEDSLEKEMASHPSILAWEIPWTEKPGGLQSMGSQRVGQD